jgi:hypothetical protein
MLRQAQHRWTRRNADLFLSGSKKPGNGFDCQVMILRARGDGASPKPFAALRIFRGPLRPASVQATQRQAQQLR